MRLGVFVLPDLNADLWDAHTHLVQEPQQSVVVDHVCGDTNLSISAGEGEHDRNKHGGPPAWSPECLLKAGDVALTAAIRNRIRALHHHCNMRAKNAEQTAALNLG